MARATDNTSTHQPQVRLVLADDEVLIDVQMPGVDDVTALRKLPNPQPRVMLVRAALVPDNRPPPKVDQTNPTEDGTQRPQPSDTDQPSDGVGQGPRTQEPTQRRFLLYADPYQQPDTLNRPAPRTTDAVR